MPRVQFSKEQCALIAEVYFSTKSYVEVKCWFCITFPNPVYHVHLHVPSTELKRSSNEQENDDHLRNGHICSRVFLFLKYSSHPMIFFFFFFLTHPVYELLNQMSCFVFQCYYPGGGGPHIWKWRKSATKHLRCRGLSVTNCIKKVGLSVTKCTK